MLTYSQLTAYQRTLLNHKGNVVVEKTEACGDTIFFEVREPSEQVMFVASAKPVPGGVLDRIIEMNVDVYTTDDESVGPVYAESINFTTMVEWLKLWTGLNNPMLAP